MGELERHFKTLITSGRKALIPYITAGHPDLNTTMEILLELDRAGADIVEVGVPFSDPVADGPTIQRASQQALGHGFKLRPLLSELKTLQPRLSARLMLFSYLNPLLQYGMERLADELLDAGVAAVLISDLIPEEAGPFVKPFRDRDIDTVFLAAPTSGSERLKRIAEQSRGFIYLVSRTGVTGAREDLPDDIPALVAEIRTVSNLAVAVGFGISSARQVRSVWEVADGAVVGSALVATIEKYRDEPSECVRRSGAFVRDLSAARDSLPVARTTEWQSQ